MFLKLLILNICLLMSWHTFASYPDKIGGQAQTSTTVNNILVPNNQTTKTGSTTHLIETGNTNLLANSSFEHSTFSTSWTLTAGTPTVETTKVIHGAKSYKATLSAQTLNLFQDSTLYASQFAGTVQGVAMVRVNTTVSGIFVCPRQAGGTQLSNCAQVDSSGTWGLYKIPFVLGATSNGIVIVSGTQSNGLVTAGNVTGDVYVDDAFVGAGNITDTQPIIGPWTPYTPTFTGFGTVSNVEFQYRQNAQNYEIQGKFTSGTTTATEARITLPNSSISSGTSIIPSLKIVGTGTSTATSVGLTFTILIEPSVGYVTIGQNTGGLAGLSKQNGNSLVATGNVFSFYASVPIASLQASTNTYTAPCGANCVDTFSAKVSSAGVVSEENADWISGSAPVSDTSLYTFTWNTGIFTVAPNCTYANDDANAGSALIQPSSHTVPTSSGVVVRQINVNTGGKTASPFTISCQKTGVDFKAARTIVGSFKGAVTTPGSASPITVSGKVSTAGVVSREYGDIFNGNCSVSATSTYTCTFATTYSAAPNCTVSPSDVAGVQRIAVVNSDITTTTLVVRTASPGTNTSDTSAFTVICHGEKQ